LIYFYLFYILIYILFIYIYFLYLYLVRGMRLHVQGDTCPYTAQFAALLNNHAQPLKVNHSGATGQSCAVHDKSHLDTVQSGRWPRTACIFRANLSHPFPIHSGHHRIQLNVVVKRRDTVHTAANQLTRPAHSATHDITTEQLCCEFVRVFHVRADSSQDVNTPSACDVEKC
jgi:hypothetical protein